MFSASLPSGAVELYHLQPGLPPRKETLGMSKWLAPAPAPGSPVGYGGWSICSWHRPTSAFPSRVFPQLISIHMATYVRMWLCPFGRRWGEWVGLLAKLGQSEISPELFKTGNEKALSRLLSGDGNYTCNKEFRAEHHKQERTEHRCLHNQWRDEEVRPHWASSGSQNNTKLTHQGSGHLWDWS